MNNPLKPYPAYKPSRVPWLGAVPAHWEVVPNRAIFAEVNEQNCPGEQMLSVTITNGVIRQQELLEDTSKKDSSRLDRAAYKLVQPGDIAYNKMRAWQGAIGVSKYRGIVSPAYVVQRPSKGTNSRYLHYLLRTPAFVKEAERWSYGITSDMWSLRPEHFKMIYACVPPLPEQMAIVRFLDYADRRIRRYIRAKQKLIALLEEQKQAIIHQAVTGQGDIRTGRPYPAYKPSGVEWVEEVPAHWETAKIKSLARSGYKTFVDGDWIESPYITSDGIRLIQTGNIGIGEYKEKGFRYISEETFRSFGCTEIMPGDVLICRLGEPVSRACIAPNLGGRMITSVDVCILKLSDEANAQFLVYSMSSRYYLDWVGSLVRGSTRDRVSRSMLGSFSVPFPPFAEQTAIARYLDKATADIDTAISRAHRQIELLQEYRTRLIADVVTGKLDVRETATALPDTDPLAADDALETPATQTPRRGDACVAPTGRSHAAPEALPTGQ